MSATSIARQTRQLQKRIAAQLAGKSRGPDHGDDRRVPRRNSYEESTPKAKPWRRIGDGSVRQGLAYCEALLAAARELQHKDWEECPNAKVQDARVAHAALSTELDAIMTAPASAPIGRAATIRLELQRLEVILKQADDRLRDVDIKILGTILRCMNFATGRLFPSYVRIAKNAGCHRNSVANALRRLKAHGFIDWVRRTTRTGNLGEFWPQLEQTSNAYFFDHRRMMSNRTFTRYVQILVAKLRRLGALPEGVTRDAQGEPVFTDPALAAVFASLGASIHNAST